MEQYFYIILVANVLILGSFFYFEQTLFKKILSEAKFAKLHAEAAREDIKAAREIESHYRKAQILLKQEIEQSQEHMAKIREQLQIHRKYIRILKQNQVKRIEIATKPNHDKILKKIASQLKELN